MGIFSRKPKPTKSAGKMSSDAQSDHDSLKSPISASARTLNRSSGGTANSVPTTPLTPFSPALPKVDMPKPPDPNLDPAAYLRSLGAIRERSKIVLDKALKNQLNHFSVDMSKFPDVVSFVCGIIKRDYDAPFHTIPPFGRYQHFCVGGRDRIANLLSTFSDIDATEKCRRLIDLFLVSVLLDAGTGTAWTFKSAENGRIYRRSEGMAIASLEMFKSGLFSGNQSNKFQVDKDGLRNLTVDQFAKAVQSREGNELVGLEGRAEMLIRLGDALSQKKEFFGESGRPGNLIDYLLSHPTTQASSMPIVVLPVLWNVLVTGLAPIWPATRTAINGLPLGDAWPCSLMPQAPTSPMSPTFSPFPNSQPQTAAWESILPFHNLTQWLTYSLVQPLQSQLKIHFAGTEMLTGLPEYRNGGLFVDLGVLILKSDDMERGLENYSDYCHRHDLKAVEVAPMFEVSDDVIVEWRGATIGLLDKLLVEVNKSLRPELQGGELNLAQLLEAGSWKGGREIAEVSRPNTKEAPILIDSDGTVF